MARGYKIKNNPKKGKVVDENKALNEIALAAAVGFIRQELIKNRRISVERFGYFEIYRHKKRKFWNEAGQKYSTVKSQLMVRFKPSKTFVNLIRNFDEQ